MIVERHARRDDVDEGRAAMLEGRLDQRHELRLVAGEAARDERRAEADGERDEIDRLVDGVDPLLALRAAVGGGGELSLGQAVDAVVLDDIDHVDAAADRVGELAEADRSGVAVAGDAEIDRGRELARLAPVSTEGMRPCTELKPWLWPSM